VTKDDFQEGDVVQLRSGGPWMVAEPSLRTDNIVAVVWIDEQGHTQRDAFDPRALVKRGPPGFLNFVTKGFE
jgi:uncharacterized protein YodC (DUF2158 family)